MTCRQFRPYVVDSARGAIDAAAVESQVARHVRGCPDCRALLERERILSAGLRRLAGEIQVPPVGAEQERALLELFDQTAPKPERGVPLWLWSPAFAAMVLIVAVVGWRSHRVTPATIRPIATPVTPARLSRDGTAAGARPATAGEGRHAKRQWSGRRAGVPAPRPSPEGEILDAVFETTSFVEWPGATAGPPLESGSVIRVSLPSPSCPPSGYGRAVGGSEFLDVLVGQDGFALSHAPRCPNKRRL